MSIFYNFQKDEDTGELVPLIIAGGGGGKSFQLGKDPVKADGGISVTGSGHSAFTPLHGPGEWNTYSVDFIELP